MIRRAAAGATELAENGEVLFGSYAGAPATVTEVAVAVILSVAETAAEKVKPKVAVPPAPVVTVPLPTYVRPWLPGSVVRLE